MKIPILIGLILLNSVIHSQTITQEIEKDIMYTFSVSAFQSDSLNGFPEKSIRERLSANNVVGQELENHIKQLKRDYIKSKYYRKDEDHN